MSYVAARTEGRSGAPLFLTFHGTGGSETQFHDLASELMPGAHVVSPRGDVSEHGAARFFRRTGEGVYDMDDLARRTTSMADFIGAEIARTGSSRVIGLGYSNGANILASVMFDRPELITDAILLHPLIPWEPVAALSGRRVLVSAGRHDPICPAPKTEALISYLRSQGAAVTEEWHDGGHELRHSELRAVQHFLT